LFVEGLLGPGGGGTGGFKIGKKAAEEIAEHGDEAAEVVEAIGRRRPWDSRRFHHEPDDWDLIPEDMVRTPRTRRGGPKKPGKLGQFGDNIAENAPVDDAVSEAARQLGLNSKSQRRALREKVHARISGQSPDWSFEDLVGIALEEGGR